MLLGKEMQPARWNNSIDIYKKQNVNARFKTYIRHYAFSSSKKFLTAENVTFLSAKYSIAS